MASNDTVAIDKTIPLPRGKTQGKYPWREMEVGDSFLFPAEKAFPRQAARTAGQRLNRKFTVRKTDEGFRCWRIA